MKLSLRFSPITFIPLLVSALALAACSSTSSTGSNADAGGGDATVDGGTVTIACTARVAAVCATPSADCPYPTLATARAAACCASSGCSLKVTSSPCGGYDVAELQGTDTVTSYYYDPATGNLVASVHSGATMLGGDTCNAGPAIFDAPNCPRSSFACVAADASADATSG